jgi:hypothetical protein
VTAPVDELVVRRARKVPAWNPDTCKHAWEDIEQDGHRHRCVHCWVRYHSAEVDGVWVKVWDHGARSGRAKALGSCPGPSGRPALTVVPDVPAPAESLPSEPQRLCGSCNPPCGRPGRPYLRGLACAEVVAASGAAIRAWLAEPHGGAA